MNKNTLTKYPRIVNLLMGTAFIFLVATIAHFLFSHLGFNPTDDGFILAGSRRILDGQIPHRDFISIRPAGSHFLHIPFVLFGGDYVFLVSRYFVWIQFASIAWIWTVVTARAFKIFSNWVEKFAIALVVFSFSAHYSPIMAWHTIDALFLTSVGIILCHKQSWLAKLFGYIFIGMAPLCRLNFLPMIPVVILLLNDRRQKRFWLTGSIPLAVYAVYLVINGAASDAILQLSAYTNVLSVGVMSYVKTWTVPWGILTGALAASMAYNALDFKRLSNTATWLRLLGRLILFGIPLAAAWSLAGGRYLWGASFGIFGAVVGATIYFIAKEQKLSRHIRCGLLIICLAWCTSISLGYPTPALATGPLILFLIACGQSSYRVPSGDKVSGKSKCSLIYRFLHPEGLRKLVNVQVILLAIISLAAFGIARENYIYREQSASNLNQNLDGVLPGARLIKTNGNTYNFLIDLKDAKDIAKSEGKNYCIIPDVAANWVRSSQCNPLSIDWPQSTELGKQELTDRVIRDMEAYRGRTIIIVQKYEAYSLASGFIPLSDSYIVVHFVRSNFSKTGETKFFELYE